MHRGTWQATVHRVAESATTYRLNTTTHNNNRISFVRTYTHGHTCLSVQELVQSAVFWPLSGSECPIVGGIQAGICQTQDQAEIVCAWHSEGF